MVTTIKYQSKDPYYSDMEMSFIGTDEVSVTDQINEFEDWWDDTNEKSIDMTYKRIYLRDDRYERFNISNS